MIELLAFKIVQMIFLIKPLAWMNKLDASPLIMTLFMALLPSTFQFYYLFLLANSHHFEY